MGKWLRVDALHRQHPKFIRAGTDGTRVVEAAWEIASAFDCDDGDISQYWSIEYLAWWLRADLESVRAGMAAAIDVRLIEQDGAIVRIHDWRDHQPEKSTRRVKQFRAVSKQDETKRNAVKHLPTYPPTIPTHLVARVSKRASEEGLKAADDLRAAILSAKPDHKISASAAWAAARDRWAVELDKCSRIDSRSWERISAVAWWACADEFWGPNIQSPAKLRAKFDQLEAKMNQPAKKAAAPRSAHDIAQKLRNSDF